MIDIKYYLGEERMYWILNDLTWFEAKEIIKKSEVAVLPVGSIEQHGPHLPLINDYMLAFEISKGAAKNTDANVLIVPVLPLGVSSHHMPFTGTLTLRPETFINILFDVCNSLKCHGINRIIIINGHGGNKPSLELLMRRVRMQLNLKIAVINYWELIPDVIKEVIKSEIWGHACEFETSIALFVYPQNVRKEMIKKPNLKEIPLPYVNPNEKAHVYLPINWDEYTDNGVLGDPTLATYEKGKILFENIIKRIAKFIDKFSKY